MNSIDTTSPHFSQNEAIETHKKVESFIEEIQPTLSGIIKGKKHRPIAILLGMVDLAACFAAEVDLSEQDFLQVMQKRYSYWQDERRGIQSGPI